MKEKKTTCARCGAPDRTFLGIYCAECKTQIYKERYERRKAVNAAGRGRCSVCGAPSVGGSYLCAPHLREERRQAKARQRQREKQATLCLVCGKNPRMTIAGYQRVYCKDCQ